MKLLVVLGVLLSLLNSNSLAARSDPTYLLQQSAYTTFALQSNPIYGLSGIDRIVVIGNNRGWKTVCVGADCEDFLNSVTARNEAALANYLALRFSLGPNEALQTAKLVTLNGCSTDPRISQQTRNTTSNDIDVLRRAAATNIIRTAVPG